MTKGAPPTWPIAFDLGPDLKKKRKQPTILQKTVPYHLESTVPTSRAESHSIHTHTQAADAIFVSREDTDTLALQCVPHVASPVIVTAEEDTT
jgi:hypothetical protein